MKEIRIIGMMRSGHHAIANWIFNQAKETVFFINRIQGKKIHYTNIDFTFWKPDYFIYNFEDEKIEQVIEAISRIKFFYDLEENYKYIVVIRDPYNLFASRAKKEEDLKSVGKNTTSMVGNLTSEAIELWKELAYEYLDNKSILKNKICVNYNLWSSCKKYRQKLAKKIGIYFTDEGFREVPVFGNGSSFDFMKYNGNAQNMKIHERYKEYSNCSWFKSIFDKETKELSQHIFKISPF